MRATRPPRLARAWVLLGIWLGASQIAPAAPTRPSGDVQSSCPELSAEGLGCQTKLETAELPFLAGQLCPLEHRLFADAADGHLNEFSPLGAALVASGVEDADVLARFERKLATDVERLRRVAEPVDAPRQRAQVVFEFMHDHMLQGGYSVRGTDLRRVLERGEFNCVSASVLFDVLAGELGLEACGLETPGHAMSRLRLPEGTLDVETTCPEWFQMVGAAGSPEPTEGSAAAADAADRTLVREVSPIQMVAMVYYNRGVDFLAVKQFDRAATANAKALWLDPNSTTARGNLLATVNNWAISLGDANRFAEAIDLLRLGMQLDPTFATYEPNYVHFHHRWVNHLCQSGRFDEALNVLSRASAEMPQREYFRQAAVEVYRQWARTLLDGTNGGETVATLAQPAGRRAASNVVREAHGRNAGR